MSDPITLLLGFVRARSARRIALTTVCSSEIVAAASCATLNEVLKVRTNRLFGFVYSYTNTFCRWNFHVTRHVIRIRNTAACSHLFSAEVVNARK